MSDVREERIIAYVTINTCTTCFGLTLTFIIYSTVLINDTHLASTNILVDSQRMYILYGFSAEKMGMGSRCLLTDFSKPDQKTNNEGCVKDMGVQVLIGENIEENERKTDMPVLGTGEYVMWSSSIYRQLQGAPIFHVIFLKLFSRISFIPLPFPLSLTSLLFLYQYKISDN